MQNTARYRCLQIAVRKDNIRRFATQFLCNALHGVRGVFRNLNARPRRTGERDHIDFGMIRECIADRRARAVNHVEHALGETCLVHHFGK